MATPKGNLVTPVGFDPSGHPLALEVDASGYLKVCTPAAAQGLVGTHGFVNAGWQKNPINFGYSGRLAIALTNTDLAAGASALSSLAVPAGWLWVITNLAFFYAGSTPFSVGVRLIQGGLDIYLYMQMSPTGWMIYDRQGWWVLKEGDYVSCFVNGAALGDDLYFRIHGFTVQIDL